MFRLCLVVEGGGGALLGQGSEGVSPLSCWRRREGEDLSWLFSWPCHPPPNNWVQLPSCSPFSYCNVTAQEVVQWVGCTLSKALATSESLHREHVYVLLTAKDSARWMDVFSKTVIRTLMARCYSLSWVDPSIPLYPNPSWKQTADWVLW